MIGKCRFGTPTDTHLIKKYQRVYLFFANCTFRANARDQGFFAKICPPYQKAHGLFLAFHFFDHAPPRQKKKLKTKPIKNIKNFEI